ncbi:MAG: hypothetical protein ACRDZ8_05735 [Acidimicrobiales bacterium]
MDKVQVTATGSHSFEVRVVGAPRPYRVQVPPPFVAELGLPGVDDAQLVEASFAFLLEHEPAGSILPEFELPVISSYFPDYRDEMRRRLS